MMEHWEQHMKNHGFTELNVNTWVNGWESLPEFIGIFPGNTPIGWWSGRGLPNVLGMITIRCGNSYQENQYNGRTGLNTAHGSHENAVIWYDTYGLMFCLEVIVYDFNLINSCAKGEVSKITDVETDLIGPNIPNHEF